MKKKSFVLIVCLVLMVFSFTAALAEGTETVTTITCKPGAQLAAPDSVSQLLATAAIRIHSLPEGYGAFVLSLNDVDTLNSLFRLEEDGAYVQSAMFGDTPLFFSWEDLAALLKQQMENTQNLPMMNGIFSTDMMQAMMDGTMTDAQAMEMMGIDEELLQFVSDLEASTTVETGAFTLDGSDTATQKAVTVLTKEDLVRAVELPIVRKQIGNQLLMASPDLTEEEVNQQVDAQLAEIKRGIESANLSVTTAMYTADDAFVAFQLLISGAMSSGSAADSGGVSVTVTKTTVDTAKFYQLYVRLMEGDQEFVNQYGSLYLNGDFISGNYQINSFDGQPAVAVVLSFDTSTPDQAVGELAFTLHDSYDKSQNTVLITYDQRKDASVTDTVIDVFTGGSVDSLKADFANAELISFRFHTVQQPDSGFFSALQNATPETSVQLLKMSEEDLNAYMQTAEQTMMMTILTLIDNLPPEISDSLMQGMGGF